MKFLLSLSLKVKIIIAACIAAAAVTAAVIIINSEDAYRVIKVFEIEGKAVVARENIGELEAYEGMNLESGDVLSVGAGSFMRISLDGDKYILLDSGTVLELIASGSAKDSRTAVNLKEGTILNEITNTLSANSSYEVNTPKATMAVRGTSFKVTVTRTDGGGYVTDIDTIHGKVLVRLYDEDGNPKNAEAVVTEGSRATILTDPNEETGNAPELDGKAYFVFREDGGGFVPCGDDPVYPSDYSTFSETVRKVALASNDSRLLLLDKEIADRLRGSDIGSGEAETAASEAASALTSESKTETRYETAEISETSRPKPAETEVYLPAENVPEATSVPIETVEKRPVIPSELTSITETEPPVTETSEAAPSGKTDTEKTTAETSAAEAAVRTESSTVQTTLSERPVYTYIPAPPVLIPVPTPPAATYAPPVTMPAPTEPATIPTTAAITLPTEFTKYPENGTTVQSESETQPAAHKISFVDADGNTVFTSEAADGETLGELPPIAEIKGYRAKWVSGGAEVTEDTVISADMEITAEYTPRPVTVRICAPYGSDPGDTYDVIRTFTVLYNGRITDNAESLTVESLAEYVDGRYSEYFEAWGRNYVLDSVTVGGAGGEAVTDSTSIAGDGVYDRGGELYIDIYFNYTQSGQ